MREYDGRRFSLPQPRSQVAVIHAPASRLIILCAIGTTAALFDEEAVDYAHHSRRYKGSNASRNTISFPSHRLGEIITTNAPLSRRRSHTGT